MFCALAGGLVVWLVFSRFGGCADEYLIGGVHRFVLGFEFLTFGLGLL